MRVGIVGAGMAGLAAARTLAEGGHETVVFEKSRGLGGRAATRRKDGFVWDTGATAIPEEMLATMFSAGVQNLVRIEGPVWLHDDLVPRPGDEKRHAPRYAFPAGMNALGKLFATGIDVRRETRIESIARVGEGFEIGGEAFDALVLTAPIPQTRTLLETLGEIRPLTEIEYRPCLSILLGYDVPLPETPYVALLNSSGHRLQWLSLESEKSPERAPAGGSAVVCQMSAEFSASHYDAPIDSLVTVATEDLAHLYGPAFAQPASSDVMRWRFSQPTKTADFDAVNPPGSPILVASDGLLGGKLHHAYDAGLRAAKRLLEG